MNGEDPDQSADTQAAIESSLSIAPDEGRYRVYLFVLIDYGEIIH